MRIRNFGGYCEVVENADAQQSECPQCVRMHIMWNMIAPTAEEMRAHELLPAS